MLPVFAQKDFGMQPAAVGTLAATVSGRHRAALLASAVAAVASVLVAGRLAQLHLGRRYEFPPFVLLGGEAVRVRTGAGVDGPADLYWNLGLEAWNHVIGDRVRLFDAEGNLVDSATVPGS